MPFFEMPVELVLIIGDRAWALTLLGDRRLVMLPRLLERKGGRRCVGCTRVTNRLTSGASRLDRHGLGSRLVGAVVWVFTEPFDVGSCPGDR